MTIGERIKTLRTEKGMTQTELAELLQTTKHYGCLQKMDIWELR